MMPTKGASVARCLGDRLDELLATRFLPHLLTIDSHPAQELPVRLRQCVTNLVPDSEWRAYGADPIFLAIARPHFVDRMYETPEAIEVYFLDENASVYSAGVWDYDCKHGWWLDSVLDLSYDCENGWWLAGVARTSGSGESTPTLLPSKPKSRLAAFATSNRVAGPRQRYPAKARRTP